MDSTTTTLARGNSASGEWGRYLAFVKHPQLPDRASGPGGPALIATLRMLGLDLLVMLALILVASAVLALGFEFPDNEINSLKWTAKTILLVVVVAPLVEELAFRSWLSGRPGHILAILLMGAGLCIVLAIGKGETPGIHALAPRLTMFAALILAALALFMLRKRGAIGWFQRLFPLFFWLATVGFASMHMLNYTEGAAMVLLPLVLPQLITGTILGYVRVNYGLWASVLLHALHNGSAVAAVVVGLKLGVA